MARREGTIAVRDFSGGLETRFDSHTLPDNAVLVAENVLFRPGAVKKRKGSRRLNTTSLGPQPISGIFRLYRTDGVKNTIVAHNETLYGMRTNGESFSLVTDLTPSEWDFDAWKDLVFATSPDNDLYQWDGISAATKVSGNPPRAAFVKQHQNYLFTAGDPANPATLSWSALDDQTTWPSTNFVVLADARGRGDWITALASVHGDLIIFMRRSTYLFVGDSPDNALLGEVFTDVGCVSYRTVASDGGWTYFLSHDGLYRMQGTLNGMRLERLSDSVQAFIDECPDLSKAAGCRRDHYYWLALPSAGSTVNDLVLVYDLQTESWTTFKGVSPATFSVWDGPGDLGEIYWGDATEGFVVRGDVGNTDAGTPISALFRTKFYDGERPMIVKQFRRLSVDSKARDNAWAVGWSVDQDAATGTASPALVQGKDLLGSGVTGTLKTRDQIHTVGGDSFPRTATGRSIGLVFTHDADTTAGDILGFEINWQPRRTRI